MQQDFVPCADRLSVRAPTQAAMHDSARKRRTAAASVIPVDTGTNGTRAPAGCALLLLVLIALPAAAPAQDGPTLRARHEALLGALARNQFGRPLYLESSEADATLRGDVFARVAEPFAVVGPALRHMDNWCDILTLHENVKHCRASPAAGTLSLNVGRKLDQPLADTYRFEFAHEVTATPGYLQVALSAADGPLGTSRYRIVLEATALEEGRSFLHLSYSYAHSLAARWATLVYLATAGGARVGFSIVGTRSGGQPVYIGGTRGMVERNAMRCQLAIEAYLGALPAPAAERRERRLQDWHAAVERHALQLHEFALDDYLAMKRRELGRAPAPDAVATAR